MNLQHHEAVHHPAFLLRMLLAVYVDPGSGSYYYQMVIAGLTTVFFFFTTIRQKIVSVFKKSGTPPADPTPPQTPTDPRNIG